MLLETVKSKAVERGLLQLEEEIDVEKAFLLVRDMPYTRAKSRDPEITVQEWRGTCSGKHYLLKKLFAELGYLPFDCLYNCRADRSARSPGQAKEAARAV